MTECAAPDRLFAGPGEVRAILRSFDWEGVSIGSARQWPEARRTSVRLCLDIAIPAIVLVGPESYVIYNDACAALMGPRWHPWALGNTAREVWPEFWGYIESELEALMHRGQSVYREDERFVLQRGAPEGAGAEMFITYAATPIREEDGSIGGVFAILNESTERVRSLRHSEEKFSRAFHGNAAAMAITRLRDGVVIDVNERLLELTRLRRENVLGKSTLQLGVWKREEDREKYLRELAQRGSVRDIEMPFVTADGEELTGSLWSQVAELWGEPFLISSIVNITERKRAEEALRASEGRFRALVTATSFLVYRMCPGGRMMREYWGPQSGHVLDVPVTQWLARYVPTEEHARVLAMIDEAVRKGRPMEIEHRMNRRDGSIGWALSRAIPMTDSRGEIVEWFGAAADITDKKQGELALAAANARLLEADRRKDEFLAVLSHELRNPLAPIKNSLDLLNRAPPDGARARRAREVLERQVDQLCHLIDDLLDITRISHGKIQLRRRRIELNDLVRRTFEDQRVAFERAEVEVRLKLLPTPIFIDADWNRIAQIVGNILQNAAKFTPPGGHVIAAVERDLQAGQAVLRIADTGVGMDQQTQSRLFEPFAQADATLDRSKGGLGLGLALIKGLVELHGGSVAAFSAGVGAGSEFTVRLPLDMSAQPLAEPAHPRSAKAHWRVLLIEDNVDAAQTLREVLELDGHEVAVASDGARGLAQARVFRPDLVICDIGLPGMDGYAVARAFRADEELRTAHLVALSGYARPKDLKRAADAGFERHLAKPASRERLEEVLASVGMA